MPRSSREMMRSTRGRSSDQLDVLPTDRGGGAVHQVLDRGPFGAPSRPWSARPSEVEVPVEVDAHPLPYPQRACYQGKLLGALARG